MSTLVYDQTRRPSLADNILRSVGDVRAGLGAWRTWTALGQNDVSRRYRRSRLGQFWFTLSMFLFVVGLSIILGSLFKSRIHDVLLFFAINIVVWSFVSQTINESCNSFVDSEHFMKQVNIPLTTYIIRTIYRNLIIFGHNILIIPVIMIYVGAPLTALALLALPGLLLALLNLAWIAFVLATLTARFRDIPQAVANITQLFFFLTPIMFRPGQLSPAVWAYLMWNPFHALLTVIRDPLMGDLPPLFDYAYLIATSVIGFGVAFALFGRFRNRIIYWV